MPGILVSDAALKSALDQVLAVDAASEGAQEWYGSLGRFLAEIANSRSDRLRNSVFLKRLWDDNPVAATGMGSVNVGPALADVGFKNWFATSMEQALPANPVEAEARLVQLYNELRDRLQALCDRVPHLKMNRVLCALFPEHFTTIASRGALLSLHKDMGGSTSDHPVRAHKAIRRRIDAILGPVDSADPNGMVRRICLPWMLYAYLEGSNEEAMKAPSPIADSLKPQPAILRRKGLTPIRGNFQTLLGYLPDLAGGMTRDEFIATIRQGNPELADSSVATVINLVGKEFDLCWLDGNTYRITARGINLLESQDSDDLADHLLTRILGIDSLIKALAAAPLSRAETIAFLQSVNPGWTSSFIPAGMITWLASLDVVRVDESRRISLTDRGRRWAERITWQPQSLPKAIELTEDPEQQMQAKEAGTIPGSKEVLDRLLVRVAADELSFPQKLVVELHAGLWCHPRRHFAVLTGLSGSGKTQLAHQYAMALCGTDKEDASRVRIIPVQPGWYDPSPLLGYVNPIQDSSYRSAPFLDLLLRAAADPERPYVAILDEMNLSHPEQYLAPLLSAMETQGAVDLHQISEEMSSVPRQVNYPANLAIIGTVNMDETTHGLSDKVLDRAYTIEFWDIQVDAFPGWHSAAIDPEVKDKTRAVLNGLSSALAPARLHFGWRTINDVLGYIRFMGRMPPNDWSALDDVIYAKVMPKLRGENSPRFQKSLEDALIVLMEHGLKRCAGKVVSLQEDLLSTGSARFWR